MKASLIKFPYSEGSDDACRGYREYSRIGVAILIEGENRKVVATERPFEKIQFFELVGKRGDGRYSYYPIDSAAILPETGYEVIRVIDERELPEEVMRTVLDSFGAATRLAYAKNTALKIVQPARYALGGAR